MSSCELFVVLDEEKPLFEPGDEITGQVAVVANKNVDAKALKIQLVWATHGAGNVTEGVLDEHVEADQHYVPGRETIHRFRFQAPERPFTYRGHYLNVDHHVRARLDLAWKIDPKADADYVLHPGPASRQLYLTTPPDMTKQPAQATGIVGKIFGFLLMPLIILLLLMLLVMVLPFLVIGLTVKWARKRAAEKKLGKVEVEVEAQPASRGEEDESTAARAVGRVTGDKEPVYAISPGQHLPVRVQFSPREAVEVDKVTATLIGEEACTSGHGSNSTTHRHKICELEVVLAELQRYRAGERVDLRGAFAVPDDPAYSFEATDNKLTWKVDLKVEVPRWPDWTHEVELRMIPG